MDFEAPVHHVPNDARSMKLSGGAVNIAEFMWVSSDIACYLPLWVHCALPIISLGNTVSKKSYS